MTLEQMGFVEELIDDRVLFRRRKFFMDYYEWIDFNLSFKEIYMSDSIDLMDMMLLEAIYTKAKELFNE